MQFQLANKNRVGWLMVGQNMFTFDDPGPKEIDITRLSVLEQNQLLYNCQRGALACSDPDTLINVCHGVHQQQSPSTSDSAPTRSIAVTPTETRMSLYEAIEQEDARLKTVLEENVLSIKKQMGDFSTAQLRKLLSMENQGKQRKGVISLLNEMLNKHASEVASKVVGGDIGGIMTPVGVPRDGLNVSDVVESDLELVVLNPLGDEEKDVGST